jgi:hypothetical protein
MAAGHDSKPAGPCRVEAVDASRVRALDEGPQKGAVSRR